MNEENDRPGGRTLAEWIDASWEPLKPPQLTTGRQTELLGLARRTIRVYLATGEIAAYRTADEALNRLAGAFTTLRTRVGETAPVDTDALPLRGCMGHVPADMPLFQAVQQTAINAATRDPRFPPLKLAEEASVIIKLSILSPLQPVSDLDAIQIGVHGLMLDGGRYRGLLLPEVASRYHWSPVTFLQHLCLKAGLPANVWPSAAQLYSFTTIEFEEEA